MSQMASASPGGIGPSLPGEIINRKLFLCRIGRLSAVVLTNFEVSEFPLPLSDFVVSWVITSEDRTKHEATFQSLNPASGFLTG